MGKINKSNKTKYGIIYEGKIEGIFINFIKAEIYRIKTQTPCHNPRHNFEIGGSLSRKQIEFIKNDKKFCCNKFLIIDKDEKTQEEIKVFKNNLPPGYTLIISNPCFEVVLYALFNVIESKLTNTIIENKLSKELYEKYNFKYKHDKDSAIKIIEILKEDKKLVKKWFNNMKKLKEIGHSNFYDLILHFEQLSKEEENNGKN
ncbi:MAG: hypothetical protein K2I49_03230 [Ureaplasma sp.]|nr:hypothetical protein [Ureaplasma sp.]